MVLTLERLEKIIAVFIDSEAVDRSNDYAIELQEIKIQRIPIEFQLDFLKGEREKFVFDPIWDEYDRIHQDYSGLCTPATLQRYQDDPFFLNYLIREHPLLKTIVTGKDYTHRLEILNELIQRHASAPEEMPVGGTSRAKGEKDVSELAEMRIKKAREILQFLGTPHPQSGPLFSQEEFETLMLYVRQMIETGQVPEPAKILNPANPPAQIIRFAFYQLHLEFTGKGRKHEYPYSDFLLKVFPGKFRWDAEALTKKMSVPPDSWQHWSGKDW